MAWLSLLFSIAREPLTLRKVRIFSGQSLHGLSVSGGAGGAEGCGCQRAISYANVTPDNRGWVFGVPGRGGARAQGGRLEYWEEGDPVGVSDERAVRSPLMSRSVACSLEILNWSIVGSSIFFIFLFDERKSSVHLTHHGCRADL